MFDTFRGEVRCPYCGEIHKFEEQTKSYDNMLDFFLLGDYIGKVHSTYIYPFEAICYKHKKKFNANIIILNGQIVKFVNDHELKQIDDVSKLKNIKEGLGWKLEYQKRCKEGIGTNNDLMAFGILRHEYEKVDFSEHPKKVGDKLIALNNEWVIIDVFKEIFTVDKSDKCYSLYEFWYRNNVVYRITGKLGNRIARVIPNYITLFYDTGFKTEDGFDSEHPEDFYIQYGCKLIKINDNKGEK